MAEEHVVLPRERYRRMHDQLTEKKHDSDESEQTKRQQEENSATSKDTVSCLEVSTSASEDNSEGARTRDDARESRLL